MQDVTPGLRLQDLRLPHLRSVPGAPSRLRAQSERSPSVRLPLASEAISAPREPRTHPWDEIQGPGAGEVAVGMQGRGSGPPRWVGAGRGRGHLVLGQGRASAGYKSCRRGSPG